MRLRHWAAAAFAVLTVGTVAACGGGDAPPGPGGSAAATPSAGLGTVPAATTTAPAAPSTTKPVATAKPVTCDMVRNASLGSPTVKFNDYDGIPLADGIWAGEDGNSIEVKTCAVGDLNNDGNIDGLAAVQLDAGGTGKFWSLAYWRNSAGTPTFTAVLDLGDRTPVESIEISGQKATVVYLTRGASDPLIALTIRRTVILKLSGSTLAEVSHFDEPYTP